MWYYHEKSLKLHLQCARGSRFQRAYRTFSSTRKALRAGVAGSGRECLGDDGSLAHHVNGRRPEGQSRCKPLRRRMRYIYHSTSQWLSSVMFRSWSSLDAMDKRDVVTQVLTPGPAKPALSALSIWMSCTPSESESHDHFMVLYHASWRGGEGGKNDRL